ncbi:MAG: NTP transferase domain-containing protein [Kosmotogaceae bacterium]
MKSKIFGAAILAAGFSTRFDGEKLETKLGNRSLLQWVIDTVSNSCVNKAAVIGNETLTKERFDIKRLHVIVNEKPEKGISRSVFLALNWAINNGIDGLFLTMGDMPFIEPEDFKMLIDKSEYYSNSVISCSYKNNKGFPTLIPKKYFYLKNDLEGDTGFSKIIKKHRLPHKLIERTWRNVFDVDSQEDFQKAKELLKYV